MKDVFGGRIMKECVRLKLRLSSYFTDDDCVDKKTKRSKRSL